MHMIDVNNLTKIYGEVTAVDRLTFQVEEGEIFGFLGPNGAGKTTTMRMLCCLISRTSGQATIAGLDTGAEADSLRIRKMIGLVPDNVGVYEELTAYENLDFYGRLYECAEQHRKQSIESYLRLLNLWDKRDRAAGGFSKGMKQKLALARALIHDPDLLFFDEPTANLDPESSKVVRDLIVKLKQQGKTVFLNTHDLGEAQRICDRIAIINTRLLAVNTPRELKESIQGKQTVIRLGAVTDKVLGALKELGYHDLSVDGDRVILSVKEPAKENPALVTAIVAAGGEILSVNELTPDLEEAYLKIVRESE